MRLLATVLCSLVVMAIAPAQAAQPADERAIRSVFERFSQIWDQPGLPGFEDLFAQDADFVVVTGQRLKGRSQIVSYHRELLESFYKGSKALPMQVESIRFLTPAIAIAHVTSGASFVKDGQEVTRTGRATATVVKHSGKWVVSAFHNTLTSGPGALTPKPPS